MPVLTVVAGPNGAGKSTIILKLPLEGSQDLLDTDAIAKRINPSDPLQAAVSAGREVISRTRHYIESNQSFVLETTLSGNAALDVMRKAKRQGFTVHLVYVYLDAPEMSMKRVRERAAQGVTSYRMKTFGGASREAFSPKRGSKNSHAIRHLR